jgi:biotin carboxylase
VKRVLLVATTTGYQIRSFGEAAAKVGVRLVFVSDRCDQLEDPWWDHAIPVRFHDPEQSVGAVVSAVEAAPAGIVAVGDRPALLAAHLARAFGLDGHSPEAAATSRNKFATRRALRAAGLPVPWFDRMALDGNSEAFATRVPYPAVIKPAALSGSRGVTRVNSPSEFAVAFDRLRRLLHATDVRAERDADHESVVVESFIPGVEYAVEGILTDGTFRLLAIFDKPDPLDGPFFEETIYVTPSLAPAGRQRAIAEAVAAAARAIGLHHGPVHAECRVDRETVYVLEVAARPIGGLCSRALRFESAGESAVSLEEVLLRHAVGADVSRYMREPTASGVMMIPIPKRGVFRHVEGLDEARRVNGIEDVRITAKPDSALVPLPEGKSYLGFIFARAAEPREVERALRAAHAKLHFVIDRDVVVV